jgi:signal transduction histidine kinase
MHIDRIARIVRNLGDFARLHPRQKVSTNLKDIMEGTINLVKYDKNFKKIDINTDIRETPEFKIDPDQMQQVFLNLMLNARDAMPDGGQLSISIKHDDGYVETVFSDTGEGVDYDTKDKLFDPFFTTKGTEGTGLGLSICYSIIKDHGGTIEIESEKDRGTNFIIKLPLKRELQEKIEG